MNSSGRDDRSRFIRQYRTKQFFPLRMSPRKPHSNPLAFIETVSFAHTVVEIDPSVAPDLIGDNLRTHAGACSLSSWHSYLDDYWSDYGLSHYWCRYRSLFGHVKRPCSSMKGH